MKRTNIGVLVLLAAVGAVGGALLEAALTSSGRAIIIPPLTLALALAAIGGIVISLAVPIRRLTRGRATAPVDPYYATRVLVLAKASALAGALVVGFGIGVVFYLSTRSIVAGGSVIQSIVTIIGAGALLAGGLVAEYMCTIPPSDDDQDGKAIRVER
ncbi:MAG: hypothetical protein JWN80_2287 [Microbacteriaceae bacterium]|jgi:hypothetical protein|nr:hypothetical protein [Microbacteriaceae bacterium]